MSTEADIQVRDLETGFDLTIPASDYDPERHQLTSQVAEVAPTFETYVGQQVSAETLGNLFGGVTSEQRRDLAAERVVDKYDSVGNTLSQAARGFGAGATFGLSEWLLREDDPYDRERERLKREAGGSAFLAGEIVGSIAPTILTGGAGAAGTLARLTPVGRLAALTGRITAQGGLRRAAIGGVLDGVASSAGDYLARTALDDDPDLSAETLVSVGIRGGLLGGTLGGAAQLVGRGAGRLAGRLEERRGLAGVLDGVMPGAPQVARRESILGADKLLTTSFKGVVKRGMRGRSAELARDLGTRIDDVASRGALREVDELPLANILDDADSAALYARAKQVAGDLDRTAGRAKAAFDEYAQAAGLDKARTKITADVADDIEDRLVTSVVETDTVARELSGITAELRARAGLPAPPSLPDEKAVQFGKKLRAIKDATPTPPTVMDRARDVGDLAARALGVAELGTSVAGMAGVDIPRPSSFLPGELGQLTGLYLQYKGARAAIKKTGVLPATRATRAANKVVSRTDQIADRVRKVAAGTARALERPAVQAGVGKTAGKLIRELGGIDTGQIAQDIAVELEDTTSAVQQAAVLSAHRAVQYLQAMAPRDPMVARPPTMPPWTPPRAEAIEYLRRVRAVADPEFAAAKILEDALSGVELDVLRNVYPSQFQLLRAEVAENAQAIAENQGADRLRRLGRQLQLPLTVETAKPNYGMAVSDVVPEEQPQFRQPSIQTTAAALESTAPTTRPVA